MQHAHAIRTNAEIEDEWQRKATSSAVEACRDVVAQGGINGRAMVSSMSDTEWGWIACAAIFGWIKTKSQQAAAEGMGYDEAIRTMTHRSPQPWEAGAVESGLSQLSGIEGVDWSKPVGDWTKPEIVAFAWHCHRMVDQMLALRNEGAIDKITRRINRDEMERSASEIGGGPLMTWDEMDQEIPF